MFRLLLSWRLGPSNIASSPFMLLSALEGKNMSHHLRSPGLQRSLEQRKVLEPFFMASDP